MVVEQLDTLVSGVGGLAPYAVAWIVGLLTKPGYDLVAYYGKRLVDRRDEREDTVEDWYVESHRVAADLRSTIHGEAFYSDGDITDRAEEAFYELRSNLDTPPPGIDDQVLDSGRRIRGSFRDAREASPQEGLEEELLVHLSEFLNAIRERSQAVGRDPNPETF